MLKLGNHAIDMGCPLNFRAILSSKLVSTTPRAPSWVEVFLEYSTGIFCGIKMLWLEYNEENIDTTLLEKLVWAKSGPSHIELGQSMRHPIARLL